MADLAVVRAACAQALDDLYGVERAYEEVLSEDSLREQDIRHQAVVRDDRIENFLLASRSRSEAILRQASRVITRLGLSSSEPTQFTVDSDLSVQQMVDQIQDLLRASEGMLQELESTASALEVERKKWWKIW